MSRTRLHIRPSRTRHPAISGVHILPELRRMLSPRDSGGNTGVACPTCKANANYRCIDLDTKELYPDNTVHLLRARSM